MNISYIKYDIYILYYISLISEKGVHIDENIGDVGALIEAQKGLKKSKMAESPAIFAYDVYYDYDEVILCPNLASVRISPLLGR